MSRYTARTLESVEKALTKMSLNGPSQPAKGYLACRYSPFDGHTSGIPDGNGRNTTLRDYYSAFDIVCDSSGFDAIITPWIPIQTLITPGAPGNTVTVNNVAFKRPANITFPQTTGVFPVYSAHCSNTMSALGGRPDSNDGNSNNHIASGRIVTVGYKLIYTGKASTCEGTIISDLFSLKQDMTETNNGNVIRYLFDGTQAGTPWTSNTVKVTSLDMDVNSTNLAPTTVVTRPEHGLNGVLSRRTSAKNSTFKPYNELGLIPVYDNGIPGSQAAFIALPSLTNLQDQFQGNPNCASITLVDDDFNVARIRVRTAEANSYRLEVLTCVQFEQTPGFPLISLTHGPMMREEAVLDRDDVLNGTLVSGAPLGQPPFNMGKVMALPQRVRRPRPPRNRAPPQKPAAKPAGNGRKKRSRRKRRNRKYDTTRNGW